MNPQTIERKSERALLKEVQGYIKSKAHKVIINKPKRGQERGTWSATVIGPSEDERGEW